MSKESNDVADLRRFAVLLSDELEIVSKEVVRLMHCLDAYQMVLAGLCVAHRDQQTVLREVENQIEQVAQIPATKPVARDRYLGQLMEHVTSGCTRSIRLPTIRWCDSSFAADYRAQAKPLTRQQTTRQS